MSEEVVLLLIHALLELFVHEGSRRIETHLRQVVDDEQVEVVEHQFLRHFT